MRALTLCQATGVLPHVDLDSRTPRLRGVGTQAEFERRGDDARRLFLAAWEARADDDEAAMAARYVAHLEPDPHEALRWHLLALAHARRDDRSAEFVGFAPREPRRRVPGGG